MKKTILGILIITLFATMFFLGLKTATSFFNPKKISIEPENLPPQPQAASTYSRIFALHNNPGNKKNCDILTQISENEDLKYCDETPKITESKGVQINLTDQKAIFIENGKILKIIPVAYQSPENVWFQTPTGYFKTGIKHKDHKSSLFPVQMPYAVQLYEDFFMHEIPFYADGTKVTSKFSGGCIRFETQEAAEIFNFLSKDDQIIIYKTFKDLASKQNIAPPVDIENFWIRQRFNNPLRQFWNYSGNLDMLPRDYYQHTGVDFSPNSDDTDLTVKSIYAGKVSKIQPLSSDDHGMGITVIIEHEINGQTLYSLYAHLSSVKENLSENAEISQGEIIGAIGNSGYGCKNFWKIGKDGCESGEKNDTHLHFEIKTFPVLENPVGGETCQNKDLSARLCYGYTPDNPEKFGYINPITFLFSKK